MQVGNWSRCLAEMFGMDADDSTRDDQQTHDDNATLGGDAELKHFHLVNALSDLLMLPKDMLIDSSIRTEVDLTIQLHNASSTNF